MIDIVIIPEVAAAIGLFVGCLARALFPFFKKQARAAEQDEKVVWEKRYVWTIIFALITSFITATILFPSFDIPSVNVFPIAFAVGWSAQDIINRLMK